jgi:uncharacterized Fe-S cluster-containing radical SAM superfamily protein
MLLGFVTVGYVMRANSVTLGIGRTIVAVVAAGATAAVTVTVRWYTPQSWQLATMLISGTVLGVAYVIALSFAGVKWAGYLMAKARFV